MSNATKTLAAIFAVLLVVTVLVERTRSPSSSEALRAELISFDSTQVDKVVIERPADDQPTVLAKEGGSWQVSQEGTSETYPASATSIQQSLSKLNKMRIKAVVTRNTEKYPRFKVDSTGTRVTVYEGGDPVGSIILGAPQFVSRREFNSYVRPADGEEVYSVDGFITSEFNTSWDNWRKKNVWDINRGEVQQIRFNYPADSSFTMEQAGPNAWVSGGDTLKAGSWGTILDKMSRLRASGFNDALMPESFGEPLYTITIQQTNGMERKVELKPSEENDRNYIARASDFPYIFTLRKGTWDSSVLKNRQSLLKK